MKSNVIANVLLISAVPSTLLAGPAAAESVLIHEEPTHPNFIHPVFRINPQRGTVAVQVSVNDRPGDYDANYSDYTKLVKGLVYDPPSNEIRYGDTVCAKVSEHQFLITRWHSIDETGACAFEERQKEVVVDNGFDNPYSYAVTEVYLTVMGESEKSASAISPASPRLD
ncbi:MAG: hypothetical protein ACREXR_18810 [Gammaproteobacteria bacterium]